jgi:tetratricopeptide (TPR) repeat protein
MNAFDSIAFDERPRGQGPTQAVQDIAAALEAQGVDAPATLFDEALSLAQEGHLGRARDRLRMLLCLDPNDARAHLLLAKVFAAQKKWAESLGELDAAAACGLKVSKGLRDLLEKARIEEFDRAEERTEQVRARQNGELKSLREEARRLRSENTRLGRQGRADQRKVWTWTGVATAMTLLTGLVLFWGSENPSSLDAAAPEPTPVVVAEATPTPQNFSEIEVPVTVPADTASPPAVLVAPDSVPKTPRYQTYLVKSGDTLGKIARRYYGASARWQELLNANEAKLHGSEALQIGMELRIPMD